MNNSDLNYIFAQRRARELALAFIKRGKDAGIPPKYLCINESSFVEILDDYHGDKKYDLAKKIYHDSNWLLSIPVILIDGGDIESRKKAGCAILFRMISFDRRGSYNACHDLTKKFQSFNDTMDVNRNDLAEEMKSYDVIFISEFEDSDKLFSPHCETGAFFDEVLGHRIDFVKPTIISFSRPINRESPIRNKDCGEYLANMSIKDKSTDSILRIKVKKSL
jgi:hypothetical protein